MRWGSVAVLVALVGLAGTAAGESVGRYRGEVPAPEAARRRAWDNSLIGEAIKAVRGLWSNNFPRDVDLHEADARHPEWAPAMESLLWARFDASALTAAGLPELTLSSLDCRSSSCRMRLSHPTSYRKVLERFTNASGRLADSTLIFGGSREPIAGRYALDLLLVFSAEEIDPNRYPAWVAEQRALTASRPPVARTLPSSR